MIILLIVQKKNNKLNYEQFNIIKTNKISFLVMYNPPEYSNKNYYYYGIIGLRFNEQYYLDGPEFVHTFKKSKDIKTYEFSFIFNKDNYTYKNFFNNYNKGYFLFDEAIIEENNQKEKILYTNALRNEKGLSWFIYFDNIYAKKPKKYNNFKEFKAKTLGAEFIINMPYLIGTEEYLNYINETFFNELMNKKLCSFNLLNNKKALYSFICDGQSKNFLNYLNNKFPYLVFEHKEFEESFILTKNDLFSYNNYNISDTNIYFLIMFQSINEKGYYFNWTLGIPFLKRYRLSFNYDSKKIGYYKNIEKLNQINNDNSDSFYNSNIYKILFIMILICIVFILGMLYQKKIIKIPRKTKANELEDNYDYHSDKNNYYDKDINIINKSKNNKEVELGIKLLK